MLGAKPTVFACVFVALWVAHQVGDHWVQSSSQALGKDAASWSGRRLCALHVASLALTKVITISLVTVVLALPINAAAVGIALAVDAVSHYWADRRAPLLSLAEKVGKGEFARLGDGQAAPAGTGAYALDQSWHVAWLMIAALIACLGAA